MKKKRIISISISFGLVFLIFATCIDAGEPYKKLAELVCEDVKVYIITKCFDDNLPYFPFCSEQYFVFENLKTGEVKNKLASGILGTIKGAKGQIIGESLDALATSWACVKGKTKSYLMVSYSTGGNCEECEWFEIYTLDGKNMASGRGKVTSKRYKEFEKTYERLGLPKPLPKSSFIAFKLSRDTK